MNDKRVLSGAIELRGASDAPTLCGRCVQYSAWSEVLYGSFRERILPGAFDECLAESPDIIATINHDPAQLLGRTSAKTLRLLPDDDGIAVECPAPNTSYSRDLQESVRRGDMRGMSFIFEVVSDRWYKEDGLHCRDVSKAKIFEVSFVTFPAYPSTEAALRSLQSWQNSQLNSHQKYLRLLSAE